MRYTEKSEQAGNYQPQSNLKYGVYALRAEYHITIIKSLLLVCAVIAATALITRLVSANRKLPDIKSSNFEGTTYTISVDIPVEEPVAPGIPESPSQGSTPPNTSDAGAVRIIDTEDHTQSTLTFSGTISETSDSEGTGAGNSQTLTGSGTNSSSAETSTTAIEPYLADKMPEFEGGLAALTRFISVNIKYPADAREQNKEGTVGIQFVVDTDGSISDIICLNKAGYGMDEEAKRVIGLLPKFKSPGSVNGVPVRVNFRLPIKFRIH